MTYKQLKSFIGRVYYMDRFIPASAEPLKLFHELLRKEKKATFRLGKEQMNVLNSLA